MPLQATSGAASYDAFGGGVPFVPTYIEDVFSTWLYTGNDSTQTITNGIDLAGKGGLVWCKNRTSTGVGGNYVVDSARGYGQYLVTDTTSASTNGAADTFWPTFLSNGFSFGSGGSFTLNQSGVNFASWTFREQPKFFDVVTWTGDGTSSRAISHNLGATPGCVIVKRTNNTADWVVYHRSVSGTLFLNLTDAVTTANNLGTVTAADSTTFTVTAGTTDGRRVNSSANTYVAYVFAHNAGGFGLTGTDNVISCGSFTADGSGNATINLGYEPQWVMVKRTDSTSNWFMVDSMRGNPTLITSVSNEQILRANTSDAESSSWGFANPTATGFQAASIGASSTWIYIAIRRGPMKTPTTGTSVFAPVQYTTSPEGFITGFPVDLGIAGNKSGTDKWYWQSRLQGAVTMSSASTAAEVGSGSAKFDMMNGYGTGFSAAYWTNAFRRAPGFFDVVCYTGTGTNQFINHNLGVRPDLYIVKRRSATANWAVTVNGVSGDSVGLLNSSNAFGGTAYDNGYLVNGTVPASNFGAGFGSVNNDAANASGSTYVAYLFASCPGVSKVGSYTGTGTTQTINCGFTGGARFVMIKRTDSTGDWYVWDTARGIVSGNDPHLSLNTTAAEVTSNDTIDTDSTGFVVNQVSATNVNVSSATYIFLAIA
jgi:hypothetical protein